jgi:ComF family protein
MLISVNLKPYWHGLVGIFFPQACSVCGSVLYNNEQVLCLKCYAGLPRTGFHKDPGNEVARIFWGRIPVENATSFILFHQGSSYRNLLYQLKYQGQQQIGLEMGRLFGLELKDTAFARVDLIHPVPLHPAKQRKRGYNQSELIARGMAEVLKIPVVTDRIARIAKTHSQTRKSRFERWENVRDTFRVLLPETLQDQHVLLIYDVITTGATLEACAEALLQTSGVSVSIASLAFTNLK